MLSLVFFWFRHFSPKLFIDLPFFLLCVAFSHKRDKERFHSDNVKTDEDAVLTMLKAAGLDANVQALSNASEGPGIIYALLTCVALCLLGV